MNAISRTGNIFEDVAIKAPVRVATTANITLSGLQTIDGLLTGDGDRVLVKDQTDGTLDGIYQATDGPWERTRDADGNTNFIQGTLVFVAQGQQNAGTGWQVTCADSPIVIGVSELAFLDQTEVKTATQRTTSATSNVVSTGAKSFAIEAGKDFAINQWLLIYETADPANAMLAKIDSYAGPALGVTVTSVAGSGTHSGWTIVLANSAAAAGMMPPLGTGTVTGPGSSVVNRIPTFADTTGQVLKDSGLIAGTLAGRDALHFGDAGDSTIPQSALSPGAAPLPFIGVQTADNLQLQNDTTNATRDVLVTAGRVRDDADIVNLHLAGAMIKRLDTAWAAGGLSGAPAGACDTGTKGASQTWHLYLIGKLSSAITGVSRTGNVAAIDCAGHGLGVGSTLRVQGVGGGFDVDAVITAASPLTIYYANTGPDIGLSAPSAMAIADGFDILASQSYPSPTMPSGWTAKQCIGSVMTDGSGNIRAFNQVGDTFILNGAVQDRNAALGVATAVTQVLTGVPNGLIVEAFVRAGWNPVAGVALAGILSSLDQADVAPAYTNASLQSGFVNPGQGNGAASGDFRIRTNSSRQIRLRSNSGGETWGVATYGWRDPRRRLF
ncbi:MAG: hypothetical protein V4673_14630 [Pseudomonadota bacterium]